MKKLLFIAALLGAAFTTASAQEPEEKVEFVPHWYLQLQGGASHTLGEAKFSDLITPAAQVALGYQFNPVLGLRLEGHGWQAKGGWVNPSQTYKWNQVGAGLDLRVNLSNLFCGYNPNRFFNVGIFGGGVANFSWNNDDAQQLITNGYTLEYLWDGNKVRPAGRFGIDFDFRLSDRVSLNLEGNANILSDKFNSKKAGNADWYFNALAGLKIALGKTVERTIVTPPAPPTPPTPPTPPVVQKKDTTPPPPPPAPKKKEINVFFKIASSQILAEEQAKIDELVSFLKANPKAKVQLSSYADVGTGNPRINQKYSEDRTAAVTKALIDAGIDADRIIKSESKGDTVQPFDVNDMNRVSIVIAAE